MLEESKLVFIISQPRSGSTMLQKLISNNDQVDTVSEPWLLLPFLSLYRPELVEASYNYPIMAAGVLDYLAKKQLEPTFRNKLKDLILNLYQVREPGQYFLDKTPRYYEILPEIFDLFPKAKYIILKRNPFASLSSMLHTWSGGKILFEKIKTFYRDFLTGPFKVQEFSAAQSGNPNVLEIKYEALVSEPQKYTQKLYQWLAIPYEEAVLDITANAKATGIYGDDVYKKNIFTHVSEDSIDSWRELCSQEPLKGFFVDYNQFLGDRFIKNYGYEPLTWKKPFLGRNNYFERFLEQPDLKI
uniref:Sulfotransferase n=1 Tax=Roseihalotalea indica TaxID=2867963 RepID=A0AA49GMF0_9BACT|nr:sulfotransferase [Tunicatimonas sp. TK19036]